MKQPFIFTHQKKIALYKNKGHISSLELFGLKNSYVFTDNNQTNLELEQWEKQAISLLSAEFSKIDLNQFFNKEELKTSFDIQAEITLDVKK